MNKSRLAHLFESFFSFIFVALMVGTSARSAAEGKPKDLLLTAMQAELQRATTELGKLTPAPYFLSYEVRDQNYAIVVGGDGALLSSLRTRRRGADVITHVGSPSLDNSHEKS